MRILMSLIITLPITFQTFALSKVMAAETEFNEIFKQDEVHCTSWKTRKRIALVKIVRPIGKNCEVSAQLELVDEKLKTYSLIVHSPLDSFNSGEPDRDLEVKKILGFEKRAQITFSTEPKTEIEWQELIDLGKTTDSKIKGKLLWSDQEKEVEFSLRIEKIEDSILVFVKLETQFSALSIKQPSVVGGLVAKVFDELSLYGKFNLKKISDKDGVILRVLKSQGL